MPSHSRHSWDAEFALIQACQQPQVVDRMLNGRERERAIECANRKECESV